MNWIIGLLHNLKLQRWHPIVFRESPLPGGDGPVRHKSASHHTQGFESRDAALKYIDDEMAQKFPGRRCLSKDFAWDGEGIPAMVVFFLERDGETVPAF